MPLLIVVLVFSVLSVALSVIGPKLLGNATNVVFAGFISMQMPAGVTKQQVIDQLIAQGNQQQADMISSMDFVPGAGIDFEQLGDDPRARRSRSTSSRASSAGCRRASSTASCSGR